MPSNDSVTPNQKIGKYKLYLQAKGFSLDKESIIRCVKITLEVAVGALIAKR